MTSCASKASLKPLITLWNAPEEPDMEAASAFTIKGGEVEFQNAGYRYPNGRGVTDISFIARRGHITYLTGETGSGKSTVLKLALKSLEPQSGRITIDATPLSGIDRREWYRHIGVVPQDLMLLNDTLATNITLGRPLNRERLRLATQRAAILDFIDSLPDGFETPVGERGPQTLRRGASADRHCAGALRRSGCSFPRRGKLGARCRDGRRYHGPYSHGVRHGHSDCHYPPHHNDPAK